MTAVTLLINFTVWQVKNPCVMSDRYDKNFEQQKAMRRRRRTTFYLEPGNRSQRVLLPGTLKRHLTPTTRWVSCCSRSDVYNPKQAYGIITITSYLLLHNLVGGCGNQLFRPQSLKIAYNTVYYARPKSMIVFDVKTLTQIVQSCQPV